LAYPPKPRIVELLNSDRITARFGSYGVELLEQSQRHRIANLHSGTIPEHICRTLAVTVFHLPVHDALQEVDEAIRAGASLGATLRSAGWRVIRSDAAQATVSAGSAFERLSQWSCPAGTPLALQVYTLLAASNAQRLPYAAIAEAYHPDHVAIANPLSAQALERELVGAAREALQGLLAAL
jgi:hypothetical protein